MMMATPRSRSTDQRYYGVAEAIVTDVNDPQKQGRVKLKFPWFDPNMESEWCRVRQFYAGDNYGAFFIPEAGDEVLVSFIHGDMRLPIILGGLYNGVDKPPTFRDGSTKDQKMIRTKGKHEILMDDSNGEKRIRIKTESSNVVDLSDKDQRVTVQTSGGQSVVLEDQGNKVTIKTKTGQTIIVEPGKITLEATSIVMSGTDIKLGGAAAAQSLVLGELFLTAFNTHTHICNLPTLPSGPPVPPLTPAVLSKISKTS